MDLFVFDLVVPVKIPPISGLFGPRGWVGNQGPGHYLLKRLRGGGQLKTIFNRNMLKFQCVPGNYLWEHIFRGKLEKKLGGIWSYGEKRQQNIVFRYVKTISTESVRPHIIYLLGYVTRRSEKLDLQKKWIQRFIGEQPQYTFTPRKVTTCN